MIRFRVPYVKLPAIGLEAGAFANGLERQRAYENVFFGSPEGARVLADILQANGACAPSFVTGFDPVAAAHNDGAKTAAISILHLAGGDPARLARAFAFNDLTETQDDRHSGNPASGSDRDDRSAE
jgi:hypothetical protein